jgi:hypothetical protein
MVNRFQELTSDVNARIREIAYLMWESAGRQQGMALEYWLAAEREVLATFQAAAERFVPASFSQAEMSAPASAAAAETGPSEAAQLPPPAANASWTDDAQPSPTPAGSTSTSVQAKPRRVASRSKSKT